MSSVSLSLFSNRSTLQIKAECSSKTLVTFYLIIWHHTSEEHSINTDQWENLRSHKIWLLWNFQSVPRLSFTYVPFFVQQIVTSNVLKIQLTAVILNGVFSFFWYEEDHIHNFINEKYWTELKAQKLSHHTILTLMYLFLYILYNISTLKTTFLKTFW